MEEVAAALRAGWSVPCFQSGEFFGVGVAMLGDVVIIVKAETLGEFERGRRSGPMSLSFTALQTLTEDFEVLVGDGVPVSEQDQRWFRRMGRRMLRDAGLRIVKGQMVSGAGGRLSAKAH